MKKMESQFNLEKSARNIVISDKFCIFAQTIHDSYATMSLRPLLLSILMTLFILPVSGQETAGSNIVSRTLLLSDGSKSIEQRVYDNGLGDIVEEVQSYPGSSLPSTVVRHEFDEYRRKTKTWLPVTTSGSDYVMSYQLAYQAQNQYEDTKPFSRTVYDSFLFSQPAEQYKAGAHWQDNGRKVSVTYREAVETALSLNENGYLCTQPSKKHLGSYSVDEDGNWREEYTDLNGHLLISETSQGYT